MVEALAAPKVTHVAGPRRKRNLHLPSLKPGRHWRGLIIAAIFAASMWFYVQRILIPYQVADAARYDRPRGNLSDLYPRWLGARQLLLHGRDPYSPEVTREIQLGYYGRELDPRRPRDPKDQQGFAYPVYIAFLLAPLVHFDFSLVHKSFGWLLAAFTVVSVPLWLRAIRWRISHSAAWIVILLTIGSFPAVQGIKLQQLSLFVAAIIAAAALALSSGLLALSGVLLALATVKPQLTLPLLACLAIWMLADWRRRWSLGLSFALSMSTLFAASEVVLPGWIEKFHRAVISYRQYTAGTSILDSLLPRPLGTVASILLVGLLAVVAWRLRRHQAGSPEFSLTLSLALAVTIVNIPTGAPYNQLLLLPGIMLLLRHWRKVSRSHRGIRLLYLLAALAITWPWLATIYLSLVSLAGYGELSQTRWPLPLYTNFFIPVGVLALLIFYAATLAAGRRENLPSSTVSA
jgi:hypothetical protein